MNRISLTLLLLLAPAMAMAEPLAKELFGRKPDASFHQPEPLGSYAKGCLAGAVQLPESGPTWQAMRLSRNRNWGHPDTIKVIKNLSAFAATMDGWNGLYIGDISQPRGGPMTSGHASHQLGLDIDIWMLPPDRLNLSRQEREDLSSISMRRERGAFTNSRWTEEHMQLLRAAASDERTARIFVFPGAKVQMCKDEKARSKRKRSSTVSAAMACSKRCVPRGSRACPSCPMTATRRRCSWWRGR